MIEWFEKAIDFSNILNTSITASWLILVVIGLRLILKKAPKWVNVALWGIVALRLLMPFSIESPLSLVPSVETVSDQLLQAEPEYSHGEAQLDIITNPNYGSFVTMDLDDSMDTFQWSMVKMSLVWYAGIAAMSIYTLISFIILRRKLRTAVILRDNLFQCETVSSPFVLGIMKPKIYLPYGMDDQNLSHVIAHEQAHIRRKDHWWKPLGFLLLTIHWFNPLMWVAYILLCKDIEMACDEKVIAELGNEQRADYTQALVACAVNRRMIAACPLAFGEVGVKDRVGNPGLASISQSRIQTGIRNTDDNVRIHRMRLCQNSACIHPDLMDTDTLDNGIRAGKVDMLKDTQPFRSGAAVPLVTVNAAVVDGQYLAGKNIPDDFRTYRMEGTAFRCDHIGAVGHLSIAKRTEAVGVPDGDQLRGGHQNQRVGSV